MGEKRILVTGGAGFIGSNLVRTLELEGHHVGVLDDFSRGNFDRLSDDVWLHKVNIIVGHDVGKAITDGEYDTVVHMAMVQGTQNFYSRPKDVVDVGIAGTMNVLWACQHAQHMNDAPIDFVLVSSSEAYASPADEFFPTDETVPLSVPDITNPRFSYGGAKIAAEVATMAYSDTLNRVVIVRPHNIYGPDMGNEHVIPQFADRAQKLKPGESFKILGTGQETRAFCHVKDCAAGLSLVIARAEHRNVYHLGDDRWEVEMSYLAQVVLAHFGETARIVPAELAKGSPRRRLPDITKLRALGYEPMVDFDEGLGATLDWYREAVRA